MHIVLFYGFILVQFGAIDLIWKGLKPGSHLPFGSAYPYFLLLQEVVVSAILIAIFYAWYRRNVEKLKRLKRGWKANLVVWLITILMVSTLLSEAMELIWLHPDHVTIHSTQPIASSLAVLFASIGSAAAGTGKTLSPMDLIIKMRDHLTEKWAAITGRTPWLPGGLFKESKGNMLAMQAREASAGQASAEIAATVEGTAALKIDYDVQLIGDVITEEELWACTTCRNCEDQCPVANEHVGHIIDMRRYLVMTEGSMPSDAQRALSNIERQSNPWGINRKDRMKWREGMEDLVPTVKETDDRVQTLDMVEILEKSLGAVIK